MAQYLRARPDLSLHSSPPFRPLSCPRPTLSLSPPASSFSSSFRSASLSADLASRIQPSKEVSLHAQSPALINEDLTCLDGSGGGTHGRGGGEGNGRWGGSGRGWEGEAGGSAGEGNLRAGGPLGVLMKGWTDRVNADPQFPFKLMTEEVIGVGASVIGDMASRPNFGLGELDFVFSTMVVCCIVNAALMFSLAPTSAVTASALPGIFASCPPGHIFEHGAYSLVQRAGTFVYKGGLFASVGFCSGLIGTALSTLLLNVRRKLDPEFQLQNQPPPTLLNASTWALQLGVSSNSRYQALNGLEFAMEKAMNPIVFKGVVFGVRCLNNVLGGMSFVMMARLTGSQQQSGEPTKNKGRIKERKM